MLIDVTNVWHTICDLFLAKSTLNWKTSGYAEDNHELIDTSKWDWPQESVPDKKCHFAAVSLVPDAGLPPGNCSQRRCQASSTEPRLRDRKF